MSVIPIAKHGGDSIMSWRYISASAYTEKILGYNLFHTLKIYNGFKKCV